MKRICFNILKFLAHTSRVFSNNLYMHLIVKAYKINGAKIIGKPAYIDNSAHIDTSGGLTIGENVVISVNAIILTHDWSFLCRYNARKISPSVKAFDTLAFKPITIGDHSFIGAGAILLPGTQIGKYCIIGSGAVVKGTIPDYAIVVGSPARQIGDTRDEKFPLITEVGNN